MLFQEEAPPLGAGLIAPMLFLRAFTSRMPTVIWVGLRSSIGTGFKTGSRAFPGGKSLAAMIESVSA